MEPRRQMELKHLGMDHHVVEDGGEEQEEEATLDWRGRPSHPAKHGGMRAASFVLGTYICFGINYHIRL